MKKQLHTRPSGEFGTHKSYVYGYIFSLILTLAAYFLVTEHVFAGMTLILSIIALGLVQMVVQLIFFMNLAGEPKPRWNVLVFLFMLLVAIILVFGSLWIMYNLDYRGMMQTEIHDHNLL